MCLLSLHFVSFQNRRCTTSNVIPSAAPFNSRNTKLKAIGNMIKKRLIKSNVLRGKYRYTNKANAEIQAAISETREDDLNKYTMRSCREAARKMEEVLFSVGGAKRLVTTMRYFRERPTVRELEIAKNLLDEGSTGKYSTKDEQLQSIVTSSIQEFFTMFHRPRSEEDKGGGRRSLEDQNAYDAVMTALNSNELTSVRLGRLLTRTLGVSHRQIKRGRALRKSMEDLDKARWIRRTSTVPKNAIKEGKVKCVFMLETQLKLMSMLNFAFLSSNTEHKAAISEFMHSMACSRIDNNDKTPAIVDLGVDPDTGARIYDLHDRRELCFDDNEILDELTGRNRSDESSPYEPHPTWAEVIRTTTSATRPNGIK